MDEVKNIQEAQDWFLKHSSGIVLCIDGDRRLEAESFPEAEAFFNYEDKEICELCVLEEAVFNCDTCDRATCSMCFGKNNCLDCAPEEENL